MHIVGPTSWYWNFQHPGLPGERSCPLPGKCMNPVLAGKPMVSIGGLGADGLGYTFTIGTPIGDQSFSIPVEQWVADAASMASGQAVKALNNQILPALKAAMPDLLNTAVPELKKHIPELIDAAVPEINKQLPNVIRSGETTIKQDLTPSSKAVIIAAALTGLGVIGVMAYKKRKRTKAA